MTDIVQFGTFDVNNYGDLLFPLITRQHIGDVQEFRLHAASPIGGAPNMGDCEPCVEVLDIVKDLQLYDAALIGGGNIIHCMPSSLESYSVDGRGKLAYGDLWIGPAFFLPKNVPVLWNAPGVPASFAKEHHMLVAEALKRANYLSVRDETSRGFLLDVWPDANIAVIPDPAWTVDTLWNAEQLRAAYDALFARLGIRQPQRSVVFHLNRRYVGELRLSELAGQLDRIAELLSAQPVLVAMGNCHGDDVLARDVSAYMSSLPIMVDKPQSLREMAACFAFASVYVGSSMHGLITASAFGVPGVSVANRMMIKFGGLAEFIGQPDVIAENWDEAKETLSHMDFDRRKLDLRAARKRAYTALESHWNRIRTELSVTHSNRPAQVAESFSGWRGLVGYQNKALINLMDIKLHKQEDILMKDLHKERMESDRQIGELQAKIKEYDKHIGELQAKIRGSDKHIRQLKAELKRTYRSFSWKVTMPLRSASRRFPYVADLVCRCLSILARLIRRIMSNDADNIHAASKWIIRSDIRDQIKRYQQSLKRGQRKIVLYTAIFGKYDTLLPPECINDDVDYVCFTDQARNDYGIWQFRMPPYFHPDPTRISRYVKLHSHQLFPNHEVAIWLDGNVALRTDVSKYIALVESGGFKFGAVPHPQRDCFYEEAEECKLRGKDNPAVIDNQVQHYLSGGLKPGNGMFETGFMIVFLNDAMVKDAFRLWWQQIEIFSRRDQLGLAWVLETSRLKVAPLLPKGVSVREDNDFHYFTHEQSRNLQVPEEIEKLGEVRNPVDEIRFNQVKQQRLEAVIGMSVDIIVCVYNALEDVQSCLTSVRNHLLIGHRLIIVNDCSDEPTSEYLRNFAAGDERVRLIENKENLGYTRSANCGLAAGTGDFRILLNSDTIVSENWTLKMLDAASRGQDIGIVGPLSNAAGYQSVPNIKGSNNNTPINIMPRGLTPAEVDLALEKLSFADLLPAVPLVHGFCFGIKKEVIDRIGLFDDKNFMRYYGEENDYCFRAAAAGFNFAIATHTFVYHRKSRSIDEEERIIHMAKAGKRIRELYGAERIKTACIQMENHPLLKRMRDHVASYFSTNKE